MWCAFSQREKDVVGTSQRAAAEPALELPVKAGRRTGVNGTRVNAEH